MKYVRVLGHTVMHGDIKFAGCSCGAQPPPHRVTAYQREQWLKDHRMRILEQNQIRSSFGP